MSKSTTHQTSSPSTSFVRLPISPKLSPTLDLELSAASTPTNENPTPLAAHNSFTYAATPTFSSFRFPGPCNSPTRHTTTRTTTTPQHLHSPLSALKSDGPPKASSPCISPRGACTGVVSSHPDSFRKHFDGAEKPMVHDASHRSVSPKKAPHPSRSTSSRVLHSAAKHVPKDADRTNRSRSQGPVLSHRCTKDSKSPTRASAVHRTVPKTDNHSNSSSPRAKSDAASTQHGSPSGRAPQKVGSERPLSPARVTDSPRRVCLLTGYRFNPPASRTQPRQNEKPQKSDINSSVPSHYCSSYQPHEGTVHL